MSESQKEIILVVPILKDAVRQVEELASALEGPKAEDFKKSQENLGIDKESWFLSSSLQGDFVIVYAEGWMLAKL